jgi:site-specific DNA recombinase
MSAEPIKAVLYGAKSSPDEKGSIADQLRVSRQRAEREGREVVTDGEHEDENASAYAGNRGPGLAAALVQAEELGAELWVLHSDRLCRGDGVQARHLVQLVLEAKAAGIKLRSVEDDTSLDNVLMAAAMGERNHEDSRRKSEATKAGLARRRAAGKYLGKRSLGYVFKRLSLDDDERTMVVEQTEAATVRRIFAAYRAGHAQMRIARELMRDGLRTVRGGTEWYQGGVRRILCNPVYAGLIRDGDKLIEGVHEAIIPREEWDEVQDLLAKKAVVYNRGRAPAGIHLFRNAHLRCGECGAAMVPRTEGPRQTYRCNKRNRDSSACGQREVRRAEVDEAVFAYFAEVSLDIAATREQMQAARDEKLSEVGALLVAAEREAVEAAEAVARIERDYSRGKLDVDEWRRLTGNLTPELEAAEAERDRLRNQQAQVEASAAYLDAEAEVVEDLARLRNAIAGKVESAADVEAVRATLVRQFEVFVLHRENVTPSAAGGTLGPGHGTVYMDDDADGMRWIEPVPAWDSIEGFDAELRPVLTRGPLGQAADNYALSRLRA